MAESSGVWGRTSNIQSLDPNEKLFLFGYSCKIFRDDDKARYIDQGKHLIPWMGDEALMIDRYDVRGYLHDLKQYEPRHDSSIEFECEEEKLCDEERYRSLRTDLSDEQLYQEEELKRLRAAIASDGAYHEIGFSYESEVANYNEPMGPKVEEPEDEPFEVPIGLKIPKGIEMPSNMKIHAIIEKTALFVSEQGGQMEIIIKMKQHANPQFAFMHLDNPLYPYYKHLVKEIKSGSYKPVTPKRVSRSEDEDEDSHYLHPSLLAGKKENVPKFTVPTINFRRSQDDSYSVLVRNLQQQLAEEKAAKEEEKVTKEEDVNEDQHLVNYSLNDTCGSDSQINFVDNDAVPPPDIQPIIQKMAEYVAKNGEDFEYVVKSKNDKRFEFLQPSCIYYNYYIQLRDAAKKQLAVPSEVQNSVEESENQHYELPDDENSVLQPYETNLMHTDGSFPSENLHVPETVILPCQNPQTEEMVEESVMDEFDALYSQDSQDPVFASEPQIFVDDQVNSLDSVDSVGLPKEDSKEKCSKTVKGPISFSLKVKEPETTPTEKIKIPLLLDDSDEDSNEELREKDESNKREKFVEDKVSASSSRHDSVEREEKSKVNSELEAKLAEERKKDKLLSAARERLLQHKKEKRLQMEQQKREEELKKERMLQIEQQRKEKQLQQERKKKAALFLKMLKKKDPESEPIVGRLGKDKRSKSGRSRNFGNLKNSSTKNGIILPGKGLRIKTHDLSGSSSASEESGEEIMITEFCSNPDPTPELPPPPPEKVPEPVKHEHKKKKRKRSRSRSREHRCKSSRSKDHQRPRSSARNYKHEKSKREKELPAAYALNRSRSRSRSPRRYRSTPAYWNRRR